MEEKYQAFAWDQFESGGIVGETHVFSSKEKADEWLREMKTTYHLCVPFDKAPNMWELVQGE